MLIVQSNADSNFFVAALCYIYHTLWSNTMMCATFQREMLGPAVTGTINALKAASAANARRVVVVSSMVAVEINPKDWPKDKIKDENCWSDKEFCRNEEVTGTVNQRQ